MMLGDQERVTMLEGGDLYSKILIDWICKTRYE
jgi:hypothetical protein